MLGLVSARLVYYVPLGIYARYKSVDMMDRLTYNSSTFTKEGNQNMRIRMSGSAEASDPHLLRAPASEFEAIQAVDLGATYRLRCMIVHPGLNSGFR